MKTLHQFYLEQVERSVVMTQEVFTSPPKTMEEFRERQGRYLELTDNIQALREAMAGNEESDEK